MFALIIPLSGISGSPEQPIYLPPGIWPGLPPGHVGGGPMPGHPPGIWPSPGPQPPPGQVTPPIALPPVPPGAEAPPGVANPIVIPGTPAHPIAEPPGTVSPPVDPGGSITAKSWVLVYNPILGFKYVVIDPAAPPAGPKR